MNGYIWSIYPCLSTCFNSQALRRVRCCAIKMACPSWLLALVRTWASLAPWKEAPRRQHQLPWRIELILTDDAYICHHVFLYICKILYYIFSNTDNFIYMHTQRCTQMVIYVSVYVSTCSQFACLYMLSCQRNTSINSGMLAMLWQGDESQLLSLPTGWCCIEHGSTNLAAA